MAALVGGLLLVGAGCGGTDGSSAPTTTEAASTAGTEPTTSQTSAPKQKTSTTSTTAVRRDRKTSSTLPRPSTTLPLANRMTKEEFERELVDQGLEAPTASCIVDGLDQAGFEFRKWGDLTEEETEMIEDVATECAMEELENDGAVP